MKNTTFGQDGYTIPHTNFRGAIDKEYINPNLIPVDILKECTNLTPFRRAGSLQQAPGHATHLTTALLPVVPGYKLVDFYVFPVDKDSKEITVLVYEDSPHTRTRIFINPWYNPDIDCSNNSSLYTAKSWVGTDAAPIWMEITETVSGALASASGNTVTFTQSAVAPTTSRPTGYYNGWFLVNTDMGDTSNYHLKYNMITASTLAAGVQSLTTFAPVDTYTSTANFYLVRFPVDYLYNKPVNNGQIISNNIFDPTITDWKSSGNELRMACGKDRRPLILQLIDNRTYFNEQVKLSYHVEAIEVSEGGKYINTTNPISKIADLPVIEFSSGSASAHAVMGLGASITGISGTPPSFGTYWKESDSTLDSYRTEAFIVYYDGSNFLIHTTTEGIPYKGKYSKLITTGSTGDETWLNVTQCDENGTPITPDSDPFYLNVPEMEIVQVVVDAGGSGYTETTPTAVTTTGAVDATLVVVRDADDQQFNIKYNGLWFDFEQTPQQLYESAVSPFLSATPDGTEYWYFDTDDSKFKKNIPGAYLKFKLKTGTNRQLRIRVKDTGGKIAWWGGENGSEIRIDIPDSPPPAPWEPSYAAMWLNNNNFPAEFEVTGVDTGSQHFEYIGEDTARFNRVNGLNANESSGNTVSYNPFLGMGISVPQLTALSTTNWDKIEKYAMIVTAQIDRNEVIAAHGFWRPGGDDNALTMKGMTVNFSSWFSRRLLGFNLYNKHLTSIFDDGFPFEAKVVKSNEYPYFKYIDNIMHSANEKGEILDINEIPHFTSYSIEDFKNQIGSTYLSPYNADIDNIDDNTYHKDVDNGKWYIRLFDTGIGTKNVGVTADGLGLKWIVRANRYIDQDTTMNYTKSAFVGQTNGRRFLVGCKNNVELPVLENGDMIYPNNYAIGVSQYDTFLRDANIIANVGDTDIVRDIQNFRGYLVVVKDSNIYALDVNTDDELKYRVVDTLVGRGTKFNTACCSTPYGIIVPTFDGVWMMSPSGVNPIMDSSNAKLTKWKTAIADTNATVNSVYYNDFNEVMIFITRTDAETGESTDVFVYNFQYKMWTYYYYMRSYLVGPTQTYDTTVVRKVRTNSSKQVLMLNEDTTIGGTSYANICRLSEGSSDFIKFDGTSYFIKWTFGTHNMPYGTRLKNLLMSWLTLEYGYSSSAGCDLSITFYYNNASPYTISKTITSSSSTYIEDVCKDMLECLRPVDSVVGVSALGFTVTNGSKLINFNLNAFYVWITTQNRVPQL